MIQDTKSILDKLPPHNADIEEALLGALLFDETLYNQIANIVTAEMFYFSSHRKTFSAIAYLNSKEKECNLLTVSAYLEDKEILDDIGGLEKLSALVERTILSTSVETLASEIRTYYLRRELITAGNVISQWGYESFYPLPEILAKAEKVLISVTSKQRGNKKCVDILDCLPNVFSQMESPNKDQFISTGFFDVDKYLAGGLFRGDLVIVAGRPSMGKSAFCFQMAYQISQRQDSSILAFSLEMPKESLLQRLISFEASVDLESIRKGELSRKEWENVSSGMTAMGNMCFQVVDDSVLSIQEIASISREKSAVLERQKRPLKMIVIDYLHLISSTEGHNRNEQLGYLTRETKKLAREINVPVVLLCQLSRATESRNNHRPMLSDLRESGAIEQDADVVLGLYRDDYYDSDTTDKGVSEIIFLKNRNGATGCAAKLLFDAPRSCFKNLKF